MENIPSWLPNLGAAGAVIYVVKLFLNEIKETRSERQKERTEWADVLMKFQSTIQQMIDTCAGKK